MDAIDRRIINGLQGGFPICERPYAAVAEKLGLDEADLISRIGALLAGGVLSRFGPMYRAERMGGDVTLAAMRVPEDRFDDVAETVNSFGEVAHNYARDHALNMWFVVAADRRTRIDQVIGEIEAATGLDVLDMPKVEEFFIGLRLEV
jgi:DNA-binding Lrp family transcriptional regulator